MNSGTGAIKHYRRSSLASQAANQKTCLLVYLFTCLPVYQFTCLPIYLFTNLPPHHKSLFWKNLTARNSITNRYTPA